MILRGVIILYFDCLQGLVRANHNVPPQEVRALPSLRNIKSWSTIIKFTIPVAIVGLGARFIIPLFNVFFKL